MNVLFLDQFSDLGGAQHCLLDLLPALRERGWKARFAIPGSGPLVSKLRAAGATVDSIHCGPYSAGRKSLRDVWRFQSEFRRLPREIREIASRADAHLLYINGPRLLPAAAWAARGRWPVLFHCHNHLSQPAAWLAGRAIRHARATVIACCRHAAQPIEAHVPLSQLHLVDNGVAGGTPTVRRRPKDGEITIGMLGRIAPEKGQAEFLRAARLLTQILPKCRFQVAGEPLFGDSVAEAYRRSLDRLAEGLPVEFVGWREDASDFLAGVDLLVVPSTREPGAPRVVLEAFAAGTPVVAFPSGGIPEIVIDGHTGFLVEPQTADALAERILTLLLRQPDLLRVVAATACEMWRQRYTLELYRARILAIMAETALASSASAEPVAAAHGS